MRTLLIAVIALALLWSGYWWAGSAGQKAAIEAWLNQQRAQGWVAEAQAVTVAGYPNRFDTEVTGVELADPRSGWAWSAPWLRLLALSYRPTHVIAVFPPEQRIGSPLGTIAVDAARLRASVRLSPTPSLALEQAIAEVESLSAQSSNAWLAALAEGQIAVRRAPEGAAPDYAYEASLTLRDVTLPEPVRARVDPARLLPTAIGAANVRVTPVFDAPWDRHAVEGGPPALVTLNIGNADLTWGDVKLTVSGRLDADADGFAEGALTVVARNWRQVLALIEANGAISDRTADLMERVLGTAATYTGQTDRLDATFTFEGGYVWYGFARLGRAPRMVGTRWGL